MTTQQHDPAPEFVARLESDLTTEYRRLDRLGGAGVRRIDVRNWLRAAAFAAAGVLLGTASLTMAQRLEGAETLELLQRQAAAVPRLAAQRVDVNRRMLESLRRDHEVGVVGDSMIAPATAAYVEAETARALAQLDVAEIAAAGRAARTEISAPRVRARDFVGERLRAELDSTARRAELLQPLVEYAETRVRAGLDQPRSLSPLTAERERLAAAADRLRESLALRQRFLDGDVSAEDAERMQQLLLATARRRVADIELAGLRAEGDALRQRYEVGLVSSTELYASTQQLFEAEAEAELAQLEIDLLRQELERPAND
jgi:hypothetical protein